MKIVWNLVYVVVGAIVATVGGHYLRKWKA